MALATADCVSRGFRRAPRGRARPSLASWLFQQLPPPPCTRRWLPYHTFRVHLSHAPVQEQWLLQAQQRWGCRIAGLRRTWLGRVEQHFHPSEAQVSDSQGGVIRSGCLGTHAASQPSWLPNHADRRPLQAWRAVGAPTRVAAYYPALAVHPAGAVGTPLLAFAVGQCSSRCLLISGGLAQSVGVFPQQMGNLAPSALYYVALYVNAWP